MTSRRDAGRGAPTIFLERHGTAGREALVALARRLDGEGLPCRLLRGSDEPDLHLLVVEGDPPLSAEERGEGRVWRFRADEATP